MDERLTPKVGERAFAVGKTGTGKTHLLLDIAHKLNKECQLQILATKPDPSLLSLPYPIVYHLEDVGDYEYPDYPAVIYHPGGEEMAEPEFLDSWCEWIYERGNTVAFIDELTSVVSSTKPKPGFLNLYTRGRTQNCTVLAGTQIPSGIPRIVYTEAEYIYKFRLRDKRDRNRVAEFTSELMKTQPHDKHGFHVQVDTLDDVYYISSI